MKIYCLGFRRFPTFLCATRLYSNRSLNVSQTERPERTESRSTSYITPHCYKALFPWRNVEEFSESLVSSVIYHKDGLLVLNKPYGIKIHNHDKPGARPGPEFKFLKPHVPVCDYTIEEALPTLQEHLNLPTLSIIKSAEKYTSGIVLLSSSDKVTAKLKKSFNIAKFQHKPHLVHWAVTLGYPSQSYRQEKVGIKFIDIHKNIKQPVIETNLSRRSCKLKRVYSVFVEGRTVSVNNKLSTSLVEIASSSVRYHFVRVYSSSRLAPILGDILYGYRMKTLLGIPVKTHMSLSTTNTFELLPRKISELLNLPQDSSGQLMIPTMLHLRSVILPNFLEKDKDFVITADLPKHFEWTVNKLNLFHTCK